MRAGFWTVFRKELVYTLRDRKTLIFMILLPALCLPLLTYGASRVLLRTQQQQATKVVRIAASAGTQAAHRQLVHDWFLGTEIGQGVRLVTSPLMRALLKPEGLSALGDLRPEVLSDPAAFEQWTRQIVGLVRERMDAPGRPQATPAIQVPQAVQDQAVAYYHVVIQGLGLVEFVDPSALPPAPTHFVLPALPEDLRALPHLRDAAWAIKSGALHGYLDIPAGVETLDREEWRTLEITFLHDSTSAVSQEAQRRIARAQSEIARHCVRKRLAARGLSQPFVEPLALKAATNLATKSERQLAQIGDFLSLFVFVFALMGGMYPAIDLGAGEKERFTLETLLLSPLSRTEIALGKALVILGAALTAAFLGLASLALSVQYLMPVQLRQNLDIHIAPATAVAAALLAIPPAISFSAVLLAISIYARSFKEAQNYMTAFVYLMLIPSLAPLIPGLEMSWKLAFVPLVNMSLLARDFLKGSTHWGYYAATLASCLPVAGLCLAYAVRQFQREAVLFRS